jgi:hypothetical protein
MAGLSGTLRRTAPNSAHEIVSGDNIDRDIGHYYIAWLMHGPSLPSASDLERHRLAIPNYVIQIR